ncbi:DoxX family protein [Hymenobacter sp.]|uniref:DoxX family protein n=1 Tax=Hymenobacter sp. TaxID=1898978 RepID=UPI00286AF1E8|nr:DoxX family protein [Hymenobacter sp.]
MDVLILTIQVLLSILLIVGALFKLTMPYAKYSNIPSVAWSKEFKPAHIRLMGVFELAGGVGLVIPLFLNFLKIITPLAAVGIALYMAGAMATHLRRSEYLHMAGNLVIFLMPALFIAYATLVRIIGLDASQ